jgi:leucine dehydrogenase
MTLEHEEVLVRRGPRSGLPVVVAVHSTALGQAVGGLRMWHYPDWRDAQSDALRLARGMTYKCALAGVGKGGGKTVIALPANGAVTPDARRAALLDAADAIDSLGGRYATGPDVGTGEPDMDVIAERTAHVFCRPASSGGSGDSSPHTAAGVVATLRALTGGSVTGKRFAVVGLGRVGGAVAAALAAGGADLVVSDVDPSKRARYPGAAWAEPADALTADVDVLVPAALGGVLTADLVPRLRCALIAGPANNQLADESVADLLHERGILWAPDYVVGSGGVVNAIAVELDGAGPARAAELVDGIGATVASLVADAQRAGTTPARAARDRAEARLRTAREKVHSGRD